MAEINLNPGALRLDEIQTLSCPKTQIVLPKETLAAVKASEQTVRDNINQGKTIYGVNTGFGLLATTRINDDQLSELQHCLIRSHAVGLGDWLPVACAKLIMALKINALAQGYSGVRVDVLNALLHLYNADVIPCIPAQGSVGASGDLAPLAHMSLVLIGEGHAHYEGAICTGAQALKQASLEPLIMGPKEGVALLNGTQVSTGLALRALQQAQAVFNAAIIAGSLSIDAARASDAPFDKRLHAVRGQSGQQKVAALYADLLQGSAIREEHRHCPRVQDPYSLRCQPQVMGACLDSMHHVATILRREANAVTDNPLVFSDDGVIVSGGNFHAEPVALVADQLAVALAEIGALSERRVALLMDHHLSGLPPFLSTDPGVHSGYMIAQVTAASLASENKHLASPVSVDSLPTSANQEDHVSMATYAARRLQPMLENVAGIVAIELLCAIQGVEQHRPLTSAPRLEKVIAQVREQVQPFADDRALRDDIQRVQADILLGKYGSYLS